MGFIVGVPWLVFLVPLCLVIALRNTRWWWLPGTATLGAGVVVLIIIIEMTQTPGHGGPALITGAELVGIFGCFLVICGIICFVIGALTSRALRQDRLPAVPPPADLPPAYVVVRPRT